MIPRFLALGHLSKGLATAAGVAQACWGTGAAARCLSWCLGRSRDQPRLGRRPVGADPVAGNLGAPRAKDRDL